MQVRDNHQCLRQVRNQHVVVCGFQVERKVCDVQAWTACLPPPMGVWESEGPHRGGYAGVRLRGKPDTQGPPISKETSPLEPHARQTRMNEAGDAVPGSQDSITRGVPSMQLVDTQVAQPVPPSVTSPSSMRRPGQQSRRLFLQCARCGTHPQAYVGNSDHSTWCADSHAGKHCPATTAGSRSLRGV